MLAQGWSNPQAAGVAAGANGPAGGIFIRLEDQCRQVDEFHQGLGRFRRHVAELRCRLAVPDEPLGRRRLAESA